jgi:hypothetical protein
VAREDENEFESAFPTDALREEQAKALADPGPDWRTWTLHTGLRPYFLVLFLTIDTWLALTWLEAGLLLGILLSLLPAVYAEFLLYRYLWARPDPEAPQPFVRSWSRPVWAGRWTIEGDRLRAGEAMPRPDETRKREEFL